MQEMYTFAAYVFLITDFVFIYKTDGFLSFSFLKKLFTFMKTSLKFKVMYDHGILIRRHLTKAHLNCNALLIM